jgi:RNA polymerase sigma factor (sigma-70 family)
MGYRVEFGVATARQALPPAVHTPDHDLVHRCLRGDRRAWDDLVRQYGRLVYSVPFRYGLDEADADEVFQNVWIKVLENLHALRDQSKLPAWLITTSSRESWRVINRRKSARSRVRQLDGLDIEDEALGLSLQEIERMEEQEAVRRAVGQLREQCRRLLHQLYYDRNGGTYEAVARNLGLPLGSIGPQRARCLAKLKRVLEDMGYP